MKRLEAPPVEGWPQGFREAPWREGGLPGEGFPAAVPERRSRAWRLVHRPGGLAEAVLLAELIGPPRAERPWGPGGIMRW